MTVRIAALMTLASVFAVPAGAQSPPAATPRPNLQLGTLGEADAETIALAQRRPPPPNGPTPRTVDGKPDLSGVYYGPRANAMPKPDLLPAAANLVKRNEENLQRDSVSARCLPTGPLRLSPLVKVVQTPALLLLIVEEETPGYRQVFLDGRGHPKQFNPAWYGHSIGRWEGEALVVDTVGFNDRGTLSPEGVPHSERMHMTERFRRPDLGHLEVETVIEDPDVFATPWKMTRVATLAPGEEIMEFICNENNKDPVHMVGK
jgi:hypothetical protein